jgi:DNA-binding protein
MYDGISKLTCKKNSSEVSQAIDAKKIVTKFPPKITILKVTIIYSNINNNARKIYIYLSFFAKMNVGISKTCKHEDIFKTDTLNYSYMT